MREKLGRRQNLRILSIFSNKIDMIARITIIMFARYAIMVIRIALLLLAAFVAYCVIILLIWHGANGVPEKPPLTKASPPLPDPKNEVAGPRAKGLDSPDQFPHGGKVGEVAPPPFKTFEVGEGGPTVEAEPDSRIQYSLEGGGGGGSGSPSSYRPPRTAQLEPERYGSSADGRHIKVFPNEKNSKQFDIDRLLDGLPVGNIAYSTPKTMSLDDVGSVRLVLSPKATIDELRRRLNQSDQIGSSQIRISEIMQASLYGTSFTITPITPERQVVSGIDDTEWEWNILATESGPKKLHLTISIIMLAGNNENPRTLKVFDREIFVQVGFWHWANKLFANNWQWFLGVFGGISAASLTWIGGWQKIKSYMVLVLRQIARGVSLILHKLTQGVALMRKLAGKKKQK